MDYRDRYKQICAEVYPFSLPAFNPISFDKPRNYSRAFFAEVKACRVNVKNCAAKLRARAIGPGDTRTKAAGGRVVLCNGITLINNGN